MKTRSLTELVITGASALFIGVSWVYTAWIQPLEDYQYNDHATLTAAVSNITNITNSLNDIQTRVDWLSEQKGYNPRQADTTDAIQ